jgi:hypothetical protein
LEKQVGLALQALCPDAMAESDCDGAERLADGGNREGELRSLADGDLPLMS